MTAAELSDSDSDDEESAGETTVSSGDLECSPAVQAQGQQITESSPLFTSNDSPSRAKINGQPGHRHGLPFHIYHIILGFFALCISGYILSQSASSLADELHLSGTVVGLTILSFATTLPEKFVAVLSGSLGYSGILVANTVGSNIFLLTLCLGIILLSTDGVYDDDNANTFELASMWVSSVLIFLIVFFGSRRWVGAILLLMYLTFLVLEFTLYRR